jgi:hypothetical protein
VDNVAGTGMWISVFECGAFNVEVFKGLATSGPGITFKHRAVEQGSKGSGVFWKNLMQCDLVRPHAAAPL